MLRGGRPVALKRFVESPKWTGLGRPSSGRRRNPVELGTLFRVHRGVVTGGNRIWIAGDRTADLPPDLLVPAVTHARQLFEAPEGVIRPQTPLDRLIVLPEDLDCLDPDRRRAVDRFLQYARERGAHRSWTAAHRRPWWRVRLRPPAPILCSYMARRAPVFVRNEAGAVHLNIAHGLYPRAPLATDEITGIIDWLNSTVTLDDGRVYAGGLVKFEPGDISRLPLPSPSVGTIWKTGRDSSIERECRAAADLSKPMANP